MADYLEALRKQKAIDRHHQWLNKREGNDSKLNTSRDFEKASQDDSSI